MKQIVSMMCAVMMGLMPMASQAQSQNLGLTLDLAVSGHAQSVALLLAQNDNRRDRRDDRRDERKDEKPQENRRDDRINRAISIAQSRGRVIDAGPMGGAVFWVRVATDRGRVDFIVDTDAGRIVGER